MPVETVFAMLVGEPWHLSFEQIGKLTPHQVNAILFHERDKNGQIVVGPPPGVVSETDQEAFFRRWRDAGLPDRLIWPKWQEYLKDQPQHGQPGTDPGAD